MSKNKTKVVVQLDTIITDEGEKESYSLTDTGYFFNRKELDVITFSEQTEDHQQIDHFLTIYPDRVNIKRSGAIEINQQFHENQTTECIMKHPHGNIHMETYTQSITYESLTNNPVGELFILYTVKLNGQTEREHQLRFTYQKEEAK